MTLSEVKCLASNIVPVSKDNSEYTIETFLQYFPMFSKIVKDGEEEKIVSIAPEIIVNEYINMAKDAIQKGRWGAKWKMAMGLYIAHYLTLYLKSYVPASEENDVNSASTSGSISGNVSSATEGDQSISYDNNSITEGTQQWGAWNATTYGQQLVTEARLLGLGGSVIG